MSGWRNTLFAAAAAALFAAYFIAWRAPAAGTYHDDGVYMVTAKALAEGKGYRIISLPSEIPQTKYPVLFPLLLSGIWRLEPDFPSNVPFLKLLPLAAALAWFLLSWALLRGEGASSTLAASLCLLAAGSAWVVYMSNAMLSETLFAALTTASLLFLRRAERRPNWRDVLLGAVFAALAFHTRGAGAALLVAAPALLAWKRLYRHALLFSTVAAVFCLPWLVWVASHSSSPAANADYYSSSNYQGWNILLNFTWSQKLHILFQNALMLLLTPGLLAGLPMRPAFLIPAALAGGVILAGIFRAERSILPAFLAAYFALLLCWAWSPLRFLVPLLPLLYWYAWSQVSGRTVMASACAALACLSCALSLAQASVHTIRLGDPQPNLRPSDGWYPLASLLDWTKKHTPPAAVLAGNLDPLYYLYTGHKSIRSFSADPYSLIYSRSTNPIGAPPQLLHNLQAAGASFWIRTPNSTFLEGTHLEQAQLTLSRIYPASLRPLSPPVPPTHGIYSIRGPQAALLGRQECSHRVVPRTP
ncbi:MAG: glycosyltransferase family 39 protein [Bryobacterales bacterium]|nr:glycosyltransferase family 39 protein [Bryobacterales bacterium]